MKNNNHKEDDNRQKLGKEKNDGTALTVPSAEGHPGDQTEPTSLDHNTMKNKVVTPQKGDVPKELLPSNPSLSSQRGRLGIPEEFADRIALSPEIERRLWELRLEWDYHFEIIRGFNGEEVPLLFYERSIFVPADYVAQAATYGDGLGSKRKYTAAEIIKNLGIRESIEVPSPHVPDYLNQAVVGIYIPLEVLCSMLYDGLLGDCSDEMVILLENFEVRKAEEVHKWELETCRRTAIRREAKLEEGKGHKQRQGKARMLLRHSRLRLRCSNLREAKLRSEWQNP